MYLTPDFTVLEVDGSPRCSICNMANFVSFSYIELWRPMATNSFCVTSEILCPLPTTNCGSRRPQMAVLWPKFGDEMGNLAPQLIINTRNYQGIYSYCDCFAILSDNLPHVPYKLWPYLIILKYVKKGQLSEKIYISYEKLKYWDTI